MTQLVARPPVVPLRPLGAADILDGAVRLVRRHARAAFTLSLPFAIVRAALTAVLGLATGTLTQVGVLGGLAISGARSGRSSPGCWPRSSPATCSASSSRPGTPCVGSAVAGGRSSVLAVAATLAENAALGALVVGGVWLWGVWAVVAPAMIVEGTGIRRAFGRSVELVRGVFWRVWGLRTLGWLLTYVLGLFVQLPFIVAAGALADLNPFDPSHSPRSSGLYVAISAIGTLISVTLDRAHHLGGRGAALPRPAGAPRGSRHRAEPAARRRPRRTRSPRGEHGRARTVAGPGGRRRGAARGPRRAASAPGYDHGGRNPLERLTDWIGRHLGSICSAAVAGAITRCSCWS